MKRVAIIQGHPDPSGSHFCNALTDAYAAGARGEGHEIRTIDVARLAFAGIAPIRASLIGLVDSRSQESRGRWLIRMQTLGRQAR